MVSKEGFWDAKILGWEEQNYDGSQGFFGRLFGSSLRHRMALATTILGDRLGGKRVLEVGCGSGRLIERLLAAKPSFVRGIDLSAAAIEAARARLAGEIEAKRIEVSVGDVGRDDLSGFDYVVGLGVLDWLTDDEIERLFKAIAPARFLFTFSERRRSLSQTLHRGYVWLKYGHRTQGYVPRYQTVEQLGALATRAGYGTLRAVRDRRLSFGTFLASWADDA